METLHRKIYQPFKIKKKKINKNFNLKVLFHSKTWGQDTF